MQFRSVTRRITAWLVPLMVLLGPSPTVADITPDARFKELVEGVASNPLQGPYSISSVESASQISADVWGVIDAPAKRVSEVLVSPAAFCRFVSLVIFVKACTHSGDAAPTKVTLYMGRKDYEDPDPDNALAFDYTVDSAEAGHVSIRLFVAQGLLGVKDNRLDFMVWSMEGKTLVQVHASYVPSMQSKLALGTYLMTMGRNKVGFSTSTDASGDTTPIKGARGIIERNTMRYFLALRTEVALASGGASDEARIERWFDATAEFEPLYEIPRDEYIANKKREIKNQADLQRTGTEKK